MNKFVELLHENRCAIFVIGFYKNLFFFVYIHTNACLCLHRIAKKFMCLHGAAKKFII